MRIGTKISLILVLNCFCAGLVSQVTSDSKKFISADFSDNDVELLKNDVVNNTLRIVNNSKDSIGFTVDFTNPPGWKILAAEGRQYKLSAHDSLFIPVRLLPKTKSKGNAHFVINAFLISEEGIQLTDAYFFIHFKKIIDWDLNVGPTQKFYFLNNQKSIAFDLSVLNLGNESGEISLSAGNEMHNLVLTDTNDRIITKKKFDMVLKPSADSTLHFKITYTDVFQRNQKKVDPESFVPNHLADEKKYVLFTEIRQSSTGTSKLFKKGKRIDFIRLANVKSVNPYGGSYIPLTMESDVSNILGNQPVLNLMFRGKIDLENKSYIQYYSQSEFDSYYLSQNALNNTNFNIGYFNPKGSVTVGNVGGFGTTGNGLGVSGNYVLSPMNTIGAFVSGTPLGSIAQNGISFGLSDNLNLFKTLSLNLQYSHSDEIAEKITLNYFAFIASIRFSKTQSLMLRYSNTLEQGNSTIYPAGSRASLNYRGSFLKNKLQERASTNYYNTSTSYTTNLNTNVSNNVAYLLNKAYSLSLQSNYNVSSVSYSPTMAVMNTEFNEQVNNQLNLNHSLGGGKRISYNIFYTYSDINGLQGIAKGAGIDFNNFDPGNGLRFGNSLKAGLDQYLSLQNNQEYFTFQFSSYLMYKTFTLRGSYLYGPQGLGDTSFFSGTLNYPQSVNLYASHQYQFRNPRFVLQTNMNYSLENQYYDQEFGITPEIFYAANNGWHFKAYVNFNFSSNNYESVVQNQINEITGETTTPTPSYSANVDIGIGIRKDFNIPIPKKWSKKKYTDVTFIAFYDVNGNHKLDKDELFIENVVVRLGSDEVLSDEKGISMLKNVQAGRYSLNIFSLVDLKGWFTQSTDSIDITPETTTIYIPYVKGVKIYGNLILERTKFASDIEKAPDLSGIKITAADGAIYTTQTGNDGAFVLFVPNGKYILSMDESILGRRYSLAKNNIEITLTDGMESLYNSFYIIEKRRTESIKKFTQDGKEKK